MAAPSAAQAVPVNGSRYGLLQVILRPGTLPLRISLGLSLKRVVTGVWVEHHRGSTRRQCAGESRAPGRTLDVVRRSA